MPHHRMQVVKEPRQIAGTVFQFELAAFDPAHFQHIIDQRQQMAAGGLDLFQIAARLFRLVDALLRQIGKADDGIHGCPDIMRHV